MIHAAAPHFLWPFAVQYAAHQINLQLRVSLPETTPTLQWTGKVGDASVFRIWGFRAFVRDTSADKLSSRAIPCVFLGFPPDASRWQFYHPTSRRVLSFQDVTFDESGPAPSGVSLVDPVEPVEIAVNSGAARGAEPAGAGPGGAEPWVAESEGAERGGAESGVAETGGAEPEHAEFGGPLGVPLRREPLSPQRLREWYARRCSCAAGAMGPSARGASRARAAGGTAGSGADGAAGPGGAGARGTIAVGGPGPSGSGGVRGAGEAGRGVAGGSSPIASVSTPAKDDVKAFNLEKFSGEDWASWSFRMELLFNHFGLLEVMDGELKRPASEGATKEWDRRSKDGFFLLSQCLSSNQLHHIKHLIKDIQCGPKAWKILKDFHAPSSEAMVVVLE
ncbi:unnamed protein product [Closterium sp. NIES-53]